MDRRLLECVPNFSEGKDLGKIKEITDAIELVDGIKLLNVDPGKATNRTVVTFVGEPEAVAEAAFRAIKKASEVIDMSRHSGAHPRMGATDVCPFIPISGITMEEAAALAAKLGERVGRELKIPVYLYENAARHEERRNLANCRAGEYEGLKDKLKNPEWKPDFGPAEFNENVLRTGATVIGARDFLVAYNVNLNTTSVKRANSVAFDVRERGRIKKHPETGEMMKDEAGNVMYSPGILKSVKGIGWYIEEYGIAQVSFNLTNINITPIHLAFDEACKSATARGLRVTGSELIGLIPLRAMLEAGKYFLNKQKLSSGIAEKDLIKIAVKSLGLDDLAPFKPEERIIEFLLHETDTKSLINKTLSEFIDETASESPAPGGGSISACVGALGAALATMVSNLSAGKKGWENRWEFFSEAAERGHKIKKELLHLIDEDTNAFNQIMSSFALPKTTEQEKQSRKKAIEDATTNAIKVPLRVMKTTFDSLDIIKVTAFEGNPASVSDAGVGALCARTAIHGAFLNVKINAASLADKEKANTFLAEANTIISESEEIINQILEEVNSKIKI